MITILKFLTCSLAASSAFAICFLIAGFSMPPAPRLGQRGAVRRQMLTQSGLFSLSEPVIRFVSAFIPGYFSIRFAPRCELHLRRAQYWLGLTVNEFFALTLLSALLLGGTGEVVSYVMSQGHFLLIPGLLLGGILPLLQTQEIVRKRAKEISRGLPRAIEIAALCMGAGLDFPGVLRFLSQPRAGRRDALAHEFSAILDELVLGHTRREALLGFADRVSSRAVRDFVNAVIQAEQRGNPLARVIQVQGRMLTMQRSVMAEESAARAGVLMIAPMMLLLGCIMLFLMGPFVVKGIGF
jgi:tight adherence protein C